MEIPYSILIRDTIKNGANPIIIKPPASPSNPSAILTEFAPPTTINITNGINNAPNDNVLKLNIYNFHNECCSYPK